MGVEDMSNPQSLYIGFGIGGMFLVIALFQILGRKRSKTWDGTVEDKKIKKKTRRHDYGNDNVQYEDYLEYSVIIFTIVIVAVALSNLVCAGNEAAQQGTKGIRLDAYINC